MDPEHNKGVTIVQQQFNMDAFIKRQIDSASAMDVQRARAGFSKRRTRRPASSTKCPI